MSQIAIVAELRVREGRADEFIQAFSVLVGHTRDEPGTVLYSLNRANDDPDLFWTAEVYADDAAFEAHRSKPEHVEAMSRFGGLVESASTTIGSFVLGKEIGG